MTAANLPESDERTSKVGSLLSTSFGLLFVLLAAMWLIEVLDTVILDSRLEGNGILPRRRDRIDGIAYAPFLHADWPHLIANSIPFLALGGLVAFRGMRTFLLATLTIIIVGGALTWGLARFGNHVGASGVVFGYFGFLVGAVLFERRFRAIVPAAVAVFWFGGSFFLGLVPSEGVSFEGHFFGAVAGLVAARLLLGRRMTDDAETFPVIEETF